MFEIWINRFRILANRATLTRNRASVVAVDISAEQIHPKYFVDEIQNNRS